MTLAGASLMDLSLSRLNHGLPRAQMYPKGRGGKARLDHLKAVCFEVRGQEEQAVE